MSVSRKAFPAVISDLESRVASRKHVLIAEIIEHKTNSSRSGAADAVDKLKARLTELAQIGVVDWTNVDANLKLKLEEWMSK